MTKAEINQTTKGLLHLGVTSLTSTTTFIQLQTKNAKISSLNNNMFPLNKIWFTGFARHCCFCNDQCIYILYDNHNGVI